MSYAGNLEDEPKSIMVFENRYSGLQRWRIALPKVGGS